MSTEVEVDLREIDRQIAISLMGYKWVVPNPIHRREGDLPITRMLTHPEMPTNEHSFFALADMTEPEDSKWDDCVPQYSKFIGEAYTVEEKIKELGLQQEYAVKLAQVLGEKVLTVTAFDLAHASPLDRCAAALAVRANQK